MSNNEGSLGIIDIISKTFNLLLLIIIFWIINRAIDFIGFKLKNRASETESKVDDQLIPFAVDMAKVITVILGVVMILGNVFNVNITALVTGLGIGGVAFALASKESLENLLGSFTIFFDKPFTVGDIVTLGGVTGVVEKVGFRSTRIRTFDKSIVTVPNKNIISSELDNLGARPVRRVKFNIGLTYNASVNNIKAIVNDIQELIDKHPETNNEGKVRFLNFGASSLDIMVLYYVNSPDWEVLIDTQEKINYSIIDIVAKHKCDFAFPSTSVYIEKIITNVVISLHSELGVSRAKHLLRRACFHYNKTLLYQISSLNVDQALDLLFSDNTISYAQPMIPFQLTVHTAIG